MNSTSGLTDNSFDKYYVDDDVEIRSIMKEIYNDTSDITQARWVEQSIDERFYAGDQSLWNEIYTTIPVNQRRQFNFNKIRSIINMISGYQRQHRKSLNVMPVENSDEKTADQYSKVMVWLNRRINAMNTVSDAFLGSLVTGMNLLSVWVDHREDPFSGNINVDNIGYNGYLIDPYFKKMDLSDCKYIWTRKFLSKKQVASMIPKRSKEIMDMTATSNKDGYFNFLPQAFHNTYKDILPYDEYYYLDFREGTILIDPVNEESMEWTGPEENLKMYLKMYPQLKVKKIQKQTCKLAICVNNIVMYNGANPNKVDKYPFVPITAYYQPELPYYEWRIQGVVRSLRDAQFILNRRQQILLDVLESQINSGLKVMEDSLIDDKDAFKSGQGQVLFIKKDAPLGMESIQKIPSADVSPAFMQVIEQMNTNIQQISGVNAELLGSAEDDKAGILSMLRQGAGLTTLQILFDNLDYSLKVLGELELDMIQSNFTPSKVKRIIGEEPTEQFFNKGFQTFDCTVVEGSDTPTQKMLAFKQKLYLKEIGIPIPTEDLLSDATFQNKNKTIETIVKLEKQQQEMQLMQQKLQMKEIESRTNLADARAKADYGLFLERTSRIEENKALAVERRAESISDLERATLDKIRAVKELQDLDLNRLQKALDIVNSVRQEEVLASGIAETNESIMNTQEEDLINNQETNLMNTQEDDLMNTQENEMMNNQGE